MNKKQIIDEFLKERDLSKGQIYKIIPDTLLSFFMDWLEEKEYYAKKEK